MEINYIGIRVPLKTMLDNTEIKNENHPIQIIDLGGAIDYDMSYFTKSADPHIETIILSNRRYDMDDSLGILEAELLEHFKYSILYRTSPLDINIDIYRGWASATGILLTAFSPQGVNWLNTRDIVKACLIAKEDVRKRSGRAFELTGPELIHMNKLRDVFEQELGMTIELKCLGKNEVINNLMQNNMPRDVVEWLTEFQEQSSDRRLQDSTNTIEKIIGHPPRAAQLYIKN